MRSAYRFTIRRATFELVLQINPNGRIPVLKTMGEDSTIIFDSNAILLYLAEKFGQLLPANEPERTLVLQWLMFQASGIGQCKGRLWFLNDISLTIFLLRVTVS